MRTTPRLPARSTVGPAFFLCALALAASAQAQWAWRTPNGDTTFSDSPPPPNVPQTDILRQPSAPTISNSNVEARAPSPSSSQGSYPSVAQGSPGTSSPGSAPGQPPAGADAHKPAAAIKTLAEQDADFRKRRAEREKSEQKQAEEEAQAAQRAANCSQAKGYLQMIQSGTRLMRPDAEGNRNFLDDDQRAAEVQKTQNTIAKNC